MLEFFVVYIYVGFFIWSVTMMYHETQAPNGISRGQFIGLSVMTGPWGWLCLVSWVVVYMVVGLVNFIKYLWGKLK